MASLKKIRDRIKSINNTAKITHAMELVAAAKMKQAQNQALAGKAYSEIINEVINSIAQRINPQSHPLLHDNNTETSLIILISSDRGLAGSLNSNLLREASSLSGDLKFITMGKKAKQFIVKTGRNLIADFPLHEKIEISSARPIAKMIIEGFLNNEFNKVFAIYTEFISTLKQTAKIKQILPIRKSDLLEATNNEIKNPAIEPLFEPDISTVLASILPGFVLMEIYHILLEAKASEHSARMIAMKTATDNALELVNDLTLTYNGIRQDAITKEILDITTAAITLE